MGNKVVCRRLDGTMVKGYTYDFSPEKDIFHVTLEGKKEEIKVSELKAVFFVRTFEGNKDYEEKKDFEGVLLPGKRLRIRFKDGELLCGLSLTYNPTEHLKSQGFFVNPVDPKSNNIRIFVVFQSVESIESL